MISITSFGKAKEGSATGGGGTSQYSNSIVKTLTNIQGHYLWGNYFDATDDVDGPIKAPLITIEQDATIKGNLTVGENITAKDIDTETINADEGIIKTLDGDTLTYDTAYLKKLFVDMINAEEITTEYLTVTKSAHFFELIIDKIKAAGGAIILSPADGFKIGLVGDVDDHYRKLYWRAADSDGNAITNMWQPHDQAICMTFNKATVGTSFNVSNKYYWIEVESVGQENDMYGTLWNYIRVDLNNYDGEFEPEIGDEIAMLGNTQCKSGNNDYKDRGNAIYISSYASLDGDLRAPLIAQYEGINTFDLRSFKKTWFAANGNTIQGNVKLQSGKTTEETIKDEIGKIDMSKYEVKIVDGYWYIGGVNSGIKVEASDTTILRINPILEYARVDADGNMKAAFKYELYAITGTEAEKLTSLSYGENSYNLKIYSLNVNNEDVVNPISVTSLSDGLIKYDYAMSDWHTTSKSRRIQYFKIELIDIVGDEPIDSRIVEVMSEANAVFEITDKIVSRVNDVEGNVTTIQQTATEISTKVERITNNLLPPTWRLWNAQYVSNGYNMVVDHYPSEDYYRFEPNDQNTTFNMDTKPLPLDKEDGTMVEFDIIATQSDTSLIISLRNERTNEEINTKVVNIAHGGEKEHVILKLDPTADDWRLIIVTKNKFNFANCRVWARFGPAESYINQKADEITMGIGDTYIKIGDAITLNGETQVNGLLQVNGEAGLILSGEGNNTYIQSTSIGTLNDFLTSSSKKMPFSSAGYMFGLFFDTPEWDDPYYIYPYSGGDTIAVGSFKAGDIITLGDYHINWLQDQYLNSSWRTNVEWTFSIDDRDIKSFNTSSLKYPDGYSIGSFTMPNDGFLFLRISVDVDLAVHKDNIVNNVIPQWMTTFYTNVSIFVPTQAVSVLGYDGMKMNFKSGGKLFFGDDGIMFKYGDRELRVDAGYGIRFKNGNTTGMYQSITYNGTKYTDTASSYYNGDYSYPNRVMVRNVQTAGALYIQPNDEMIVIGVYKGQNLGGDVTLYLDEPERQNGHKIYVKNISSNNFYVNSMPEYNNPNAYTKCIMEAGSNNEVSRYSAGCYSMMLIAAGFDWIVYYCN